MSSATLAAEQKLLLDMYGTVNKSRSREYIFSYLARSVGYLSKSINAHQKEHVHLARSLSWLLALSNKLDISLEASFVTKYPGVCPYCVTAPCVCYQTHKKPYKPMPIGDVIDTLHYKKDQYTATTGPQTLTSVQRTLQQIYPHNNAVVKYAGPAFILLKLHEELAELHEAMSKFAIGERKLIAVEEEAADVLAWIVAAASACFPGENLDDLLVGHYAKGCPVCTSVVCKCLDYGSRATGLLDKHEL